MAKIMVVEDEGVEAMDLENTLVSMGHEVVYIASMGDEAVVKSNELLPELVLMDIILKGEMNGI